MQDPDWSDEDRAWALAWQAEEATKCKGCGHPLDETTSKEARRDRDAYWVDEIVCAACETRDAVAKEMSAAEDEQGGGRYWTVKRRDEA